MSVPCDPTAKMFALTAIALLMGTACKNKQPDAWLTVMTEGPVVLEPGGTIGVSASYTVVNDEGFEVAANAGTWTMSQALVDAGATLDGGAEPVELVEPSFKAPYLSGSYELTNAHPEDPEGPYVLEVQVVAHELYVDPPLWRTGRSLEGSLGPPRWSPDGTGILAQTLSAVRVLDADTLQQRFGAKIGRSGATWTANGELLIGEVEMPGALGHVALYDGTTGERLLDMPDHYETALLVGHPDGGAWLESAEPSLAPTEPGFARLTDARLGVHTEEITPFKATTAAFDPTGGFMALGHDNLRIVETNTWGTFTEPSGATNVGELMWSDDGQEVLALLDWDGDGGARIQRIDMLSGVASWELHPAIDTVLDVYPPQTLAASGDFGAIWIALENGMLRRYDAGALSWEADLGVEMPRGLTLSPDGSELAVDLSGRLSILDATDGSVLRQAVQLSDVSDVQLSPDASAVAVADVNGLAVFELADGSMRWWNGEPGNQLTRLRWSPDGTELVAMHGAVVSFYAGTDGEELRSFDVGIEFTQPVWTDHGVLIEDDWQGSLLIDPSTGAEIRRVPCAYQLQRVGGDVVYGRNREDVGPELLRCTVADGEYEAVVDDDIGNRWKVSPDGSLVLVEVFGGGTEVWSTQTGAMVASLPGMGAEPEAIGWSADGTLVLTAHEGDPDQQGARHVVAWWDPSTGDKVTQWDSPVDRNLVGRVVGLPDGGALTGGAELIRWPAGGRGR